MNTKIVRIALLSLGLTACTALAEDTNKFKSDLERYSYALGMSWGTQLKQGDVEVDYEQMLRGFKETKAGASVLTDAEMRLGPAQWRNFADPFPIWNKTVEEVLSES